MSCWKCGGPWRVLDGETFCLYCGARPRRDLEPGEDPETHTWTNLPPDTRTPEEIADARRLWDSLGK